MEMPVIMELMERMEIMGTLKDNENDGVNDFIPKNPHYHAISIINYLRDGFCEIEGDDGLSNTSFDVSSKDIL